MSIEERLAKLVNLPVFDKLRVLQPQFGEKLQAVQCDIEKEGFGLDQHTLNTLHDEVNVFFHCAATLRFNEELRLAFQVNTLAIRSVLKLCSKMKDLNALVHVSTAYSFCERKDIGEEVYETGWNYDQVKSSVSWMDDDMLKKITPDLLRKRPNTYILTKALGEELLVTEGRGLPICIVRPSIIGATYQDPMPGWCTTMNGATGVLVAYGKGLINVLPAHCEKYLDLIPVDFVVNGTIAAGWKIAQSSKSCLNQADTIPGCSGILLNENKEHSTASLEDVDHRKTVPIYNIVSSKLNPISFRRINKMIASVYNDYPLDNAFSSPAVSLISNKYMHQMLQFLTQYVPALFIDLALTILGRKPKLVRLSKKCTQSIEVLEHFLTHQWNWNVDSVVQLQNELSPEDRKTFHFDVRALDWKYYIQSYAKGTRKYLLKEDESGYPAARQHIRRLRIIGYCMQLAVFMISWRLFVPRTGIAKNLWQFVMSMAYKLVKSFQISSTLHSKSFFAKAIFS